MQALWPVPMDVRSWPEAKEINPVLVRALKAMRSMDPAGVSGNFYASFYTGNSNSKTVCRVILNFVTIFDKEDIK